MPNRSLQEDEKREEEGAVGQLPSMDAAEDPKRKPRNRKKAQAKKAAKQKKKTLGDEELDKRQAEGGYEGESQDLIGQDQLANETEEGGGGAQAITDDKEGGTSPKIWKI